MNLIFFLILMVASLGLVLLALRHSLTALYVALSILYVITNLTAGKVVIVDFWLFAIPASAAAPLYASIFLGTDMIAEHFSIKDAFRAIWFGFASQITLLVVGLLIAAMTAVPDNFLAEPLGVIFGFTPRLVVGSLIAFMCAQHFDVWFYHKLKNLHGRRFLWLRNNLSTIISQFIDSFLVFVIAFSSVFDNWVAIMFSTYIIKVIVALADTPWLYFSRRFVSPSGEQDVPTQNT